MTNIKEDGVERLRKTPNEILIAASGDKSSALGEAFWSFLLSQGYHKSNLGLLAFSGNTRIQDSNANRVSLDVAKFQQERQNFQPDISIILFTEGEYNSLERTRQTILEIKKTYPRTFHLLVDMPPYPSDISLVNTEREKWSSESLAPESNILYMRLNPQLGKRSDSTEKDFLFALSTFLGKRSSKLNPVNPLDLLRSLKRTSNFVGAGMGRQEIYLRKGAFPWSKYIVDPTELMEKATKAVESSLSEEKLLTINIPISHTPNYLVLCMPPVDPAISQEILNGFLENRSGDIVCVSSRQMLNFEGYEGFPTGRVVALNLFAAR